MMIDRTAARPKSPAWHYDAAADVGQSFVERLRRFPRYPDMLVYGARVVAALVIRAWLRTYHRLDIVGRENLPRDGSFILVANHSSHLDAIALQAALPLNKLHRVFCAAASDYFFQNLPLTWMATIVANALPFSRELRAGQSLGLCAALLRNRGNVLILFPEGSRTPDGAARRFKPGVGVLLASRRISVVPCHFAGAFAAWPKGRVIPRPRKLTLRIGTPMTYAHLEANRENAFAIAADLERAVAELGEARASRTTTKI
jgi:1-acyl-sn-glycerol-3-phosphate acyltransferase